MARLELTNVRKVFEQGTEHEVCALAGITVVFLKGDFVTIVGSNGAGKTTLLNAVAGVVAIDAGRIDLDGEPVQDQPEHVRARQIGRVFQNPASGLATSLTVRENVVLQLRKNRRASLRSAYRQEDSEAALASLKDLGLGLESRLDVPVRYLSFGQMQALSVHLATMIEPKVVLLDEHCSALDPRTAVTVMEISSEAIHRGGLTALMVTHSLRLALKYGNRLVLMHAGAITLDIAGDQKVGLSEGELLALFREKVANGASLRDKALL